MVKLQVRGFAAVMTGRIAAKKSPSTSGDAGSPTGYGHRAIAYTKLVTPEWKKALADMDRHVELFEGHDPHAKLWSSDLDAITLQLEELKQVGPEWDGPGTITPDAEVVDSAAAWLTEHWRSDGVSMEWCQYNPRTLQTVETELRLDRQGWESVLAGLNQPAV